MKRLSVAMVAAARRGAAPARADVCDDHPEAPSRGPGDMVMVARGADGALYERHTVPGAWTQEAAIGGTVQSGPAVVAYAGAIHAPYVRLLRLDRPAGSTGRVYARAFSTRKGLKKLRRKTVSKRYVICG